VEVGDVVDVAFQPQVNEFRGERSVQLNIMDIRPHCTAEVGCETTLHRRMHAGTLSPQEAARLLPDRATLAMVWRYLAGRGSDVIREEPICLCRKIVRRSGTALDVGQLLTCLDIFADVGLLQVQRMTKHLHICLTPGTGKADLQQSATMQHLLNKKES
jgi:single-stranded-DNA-specific exonuclease